MDFPFTAGFLLIGSFPHTEGVQLGGGLFRPSAVGFGAGRAGMKNFADFQRFIAENALRTFLGEITNTNDPLRLQKVDHPHQMPVASFEDWRHFAGGEFVRRAIAATGFAEN